jgi:glycosyltransferase involved in cell wall biosynthesis
MNRNEKQPLVTVLMTVYNAERFIGEALESIVNQTYKNLEIIVVDDGSSDKSYQIAKTYQVKDKRIKLLRLKENSGPSLASNVGIEKATGKFIARMDADDIALPDRIAKQVTYLLDNPDVVLLGGQCILIDDRGRIVGEKDFPVTHREIYQSLFNINPIQHPSCIINRELLPKEHVYYRNHSFLAHDLELVFELAQYGELANLKETVLFYRQYPNSLSLRNPKKTFKATVEVRNKAVRKYGYQPTLSGWLIHFAQAILIAVLPNATIYPLFRLLRLKGKEDISQALRDIYLYSKANFSLFKTFK